MRARSIVPFLAVCLLCGACAPADTGGPDAAEAPAGWERYVDEVSGFSVAYPADLLSLHQEGTAAVFRHAVPFEHPDPCDFRGDAPALPVLTDFRLSLDVLEKTLRDAITETEGSEYVVSTFLRDGKLRASDDGSVGPVEFGALRGYRVTSGVEGCGRHAYYFATPTGRTLVALRQLVPELRGATAADALRIPGVIPSEEEEDLSATILSTVSFAGQSTGTGSAR
jgi:hypothetical protein